MTANTMRRVAVIAALGVLVTACTTGSDGDGDDATIVGSESATTTTSTERGPVDTDTMPDGSPARFLYRAQTTDDARDDQLRLRDRRTGIEDLIDTGDIGAVSVDHASGTVWWSRPDLGVTRWKASDGRTGEVDGLWLVTSDGTRVNVAADELAGSPSPGECGWTLVVIEPDGATAEHSMPDAPVLHGDESSCRRSGIAAIAPDGVSVVLSWWIDGDGAASQVYDLGSRMFGEPWTHSDQGDTIWLDDHTVLQTHRWVDWGSFGMRTLLDLRDGEPRVVEETDLRAWVWPSAPDPATGWRAERVSGEQEWRRCSSPPSIEGSCSDGFSESSEWEEISETPPRDMTAYCELHLISPGGARTVTDEPCVDAIFVPAVW